MRAEQVEQKRVLVTGGAGFIGSNLVDGLLASGEYRVRVLDNFSTGHRKNIEHCLSDIELIEGDMRDMETVEAAVEGVDAILHEAALPSVPRSIKAPITSNEVNVGGTVKLFSSAQKAGVKRIIIASSSSVYGNTLELPKRETMTPQPMSPYAVTKLADEHYLRVFSSLYDIDALAFRYFNVFGPRQDPHSQYSGVIAKFMQAALGAGECTVNGDGLQSRDFTFVANVVDANLRALEADGLKGQAVNIACGGRISLLDLMHAIEAASGRKLMPLFGPDRSGDVRDSQADITEVHKLLGYEPLVSFGEGIERTFAWYRQENVS